MNATMTLNVTADPVGELAEAAANHGYRIDRIITSEDTRFTVAVTRVVDGPLDDDIDDETFTDLFATNCSTLLDEGDNT